MNDTEPKAATLTLQVNLNPSLVKFAKAEMRRVKLLRGRLATLVCLCEDSDLYYYEEVRVRGGP